MFAAIGECMVEINAPPVSDDSQTRFPADIGFGGDTLNSVVYLSRAGITVTYVSAVGDDPLSDWLVAAWRRESINTDLEYRIPGSPPGLYMIHVDDRGERSFSYWRKHSPASRLLDDPARAELVFDALITFEIIYFSGITLAIYSREARARLFRFLAKFRADGGRVCFDNNYRANLWRSAAAARGALNEAYALATIAMPTNDDEHLLFGLSSEDEIVARLIDTGVEELVLKLGADGCRVVHGNTDTRVAPAQAVTVVDSTAAGDSFNAGYLAARITGSTPEQAAVAGNRLAARVIRHRGAILPREQTPELAGGCPEK